MTARLRSAWEWHVRIPLCCAGIVACRAHGSRHEVDATWLAVDWPQEWTR